MGQQQKIDKRQNELRTYLATAYKGKVKGVMDDDTFVILSNQFKRERDQLKKQQKSRQNLRPPRSSGTVSCVLRGEAKVKLKSKF